MAQGALDHASTSPANHQRCLDATVASDGPLGHALEDVNVEVAENGEAPRTMLPPASGRVSLCFHEGTKRIHLTALKNGFQPYTADIDADTATQPVSIVLHSL